MTTFTTKNQSRKRYYRALGAAIIIIILVTLIIWTRRDRYKELNKTTNHNSNDNRFKNGASNTNTDKRRPAFYSDELIEYEPVVLVQGLQIKGQVRTVANGKTVASYLGVPYAEPPIDGRRFLPPEDKQPPGDDEEQPKTLDAFYQPFKCYQSSFVLSITEVKSLGEESREDCLYLNIWTPFEEGCDDCNKTTTNNSSNKAKPVMIFIHSGLFQYGGIGSPDLDPSLLVAEKDIVAITIQYRLGVFGFGSSESQLADDNFQSLGLQDQAKALEWVRKNVGKFGGNPNQITLAGHGAGAVSIGFHLMHPVTKKMFQRAIVQGVQNIWHIGMYGMNSKSVRFLMEDSNCNGESVKKRDLNECLNKQRIKPIILLEGQQYLVDAFSIPFVPEFHPLTKELEEKLQSFQPEARFNDSLLVKLFKDWNIFSPDHEIMIGINSDDDYQFEKVNKISTNVRFGDPPDFLDEYGYAEDTSGDEEEEEEEGEEEEETDENQEESNNDNEKENKTEVEDDENKPEEVENDENEESNDGDKDNVNISDEIKVKDTSEENKNNNDDKKMEMIESTTMKMETTMDDHGEEGVLKQHRRRRRRRRRQILRRPRRQLTFSDYALKLDKDEKIKFCRLVRMYYLQWVTKEKEDQVSTKIVLYRIDPKVLVDVLEEVSFAFGAKNNWLKNLDHHTMNVWGSFVNDGISGIKASDKELENYFSRMGSDTVQVINIGQKNEDDNHSQLSIRMFDWFHWCPP